MTDKRHEATLRAVAFLRMIIREELMKPSDRAIAQDIVDEYDYGRLTPCPTCGDKFCAKHEAYLWPTPPSTTPTCNNRVSPA